MRGLDFFIALTLPGAVPRAKGTAASSLAVFPGQERKCWQIPVTAGVDSCEELYLIGQTTKCRSPGVAQRWTEKAWLSIYHHQHPHHPHPQQQQFFMPFFNSNK